MKLFFLFFIALKAISIELFAAEAGMPQLDPQYWASQAFWLILVFTILYISISKFYLPKIKDNIDNRENKIKEDLENAQKYKEQSEKKLQEYEAIIENAKKEAAAEAFKLRDQLRIEVSKLAIKGAEQILEKQIDEKTHLDILKKLEAEL